MTHNPYAVHPRKPLTEKQLLKLFLDNDGICCLCGERINGVKQAWDEHIKPLWLDGTNDISNRGVAHDVCARRKTAKEAGIRAKIQRVAEKHMGARRAKTKPMPFGRKSKLKRKMDGSIVER